jgi:hypothetical protein
VQCEALDWTAARVVTATLCMVVCACVSERERECVCTRETSRNIDHHVDTFVCCLPVLHKERTSMKCVCVCVCVSADV